MPCLATRSPWSGERTSRVSETNISMVQYLWCVRDQKPWTRPMSHCSDYLHVKLFGQNKIVLCDTLQFPTPPWPTSVSRGGRKDGRRRQWVSEWWKEVELKMWQWQQVREKAAADGRIMALLSRADTEVLGRHSGAQQPGDCTLPQPPNTMPGRLHDSPGSEQRQNVQDEKWFLYWTGPPWKPAEIHDAPGMHTLVSMVHCPDCVETRGSCGCPWSYSNREPWCLWYKVSSKVIQMFLAWATAWGHPDCL